MKWPWVARRRLEQAEVDKSLLRHQVRELEARLRAEPFRLADQIDETFRLLHGLGHTFRPPGEYPLPELREAAPEEACRHGYGLDHCPRGCTVPSVTPYVDG